MFFYMLFAKHGHLVPFADNVAVQNFTPFAQLECIIGITMGKLLQFTLGAATRPETCPRD